MYLRPYQPEDCAVLAALFYDTVHTVNAQDYTKEQLDVWATGATDLVAWNRSFLKHHTIVAVEDNIIVGFGDIDVSGYLDRLFVHKDYQRRGYATAICDALEETVDTVTITTHASITARPFFEQRGYRVVRQQQICRQNVWLTNYVMEKQK